VYVAKVKNILVGLPATDTEIEAVEADPAALSTLVEGWLQLPQAALKLQRFFELAFQQTQISSNDFSDQIRAQISMNPKTQPLILQNVQESFARTMVALTLEGKPLTSAITTRQLMMTTALKELYAFLDVWQIDNDGNIFDSFRAENRSLQITVQASEGPIPIEQSLDPNSPNYMRWYNPDVGSAEAQVEGCRQDPVSLAPKARSMHYLLLGTIDGRNLRTGEYCQPSDGTAKGPQFSDYDFKDWQLVTLREPNPGEKPTLFYDVPSLRKATELVLKTPRVGFFSTPAFFANWQTNASNQMRVTLNQALIVATGSAIDTADKTLPPGTPGLDAAHSQADCFTCHRTLDPSRSILAATWSWNYHNQMDETWQSQRGSFAFRGVVEPVQTIYDFANVLARHPLVGPGWVQKLCHYFNSAPCAEADPEFQRVVAVFESSGYSFISLLKTLATSPLTTHATETETARNRGEVVVVSRRDHLCAALNARLGFKDVCGLDALNKGGTTSDISAIVSGLPSDAYGRGAIAPILPNEPSPFFVAGLENICKTVAQKVVDPAPDTEPVAAKTWRSSAPEQAISEFVSIVMALNSGDPRTERARALLTAHFDAALEAPQVTATQALQSTFVLACLAPSAVSIGL
jgi:hypothetical protein